MNREQREEASRRWVQAAAQTPEAKALIALGWQVVSPYGYTHGTGWSIGEYCTDGEWETILWEGKRLHDRFSTPLEAAQHHARIVATATH